MKVILRAPGSPSGGRAAENSRQPGADVSRSRAAGQVCLYARTSERSRRANSPCDCRDGLNLDQGRRNAIAGPTRNYGRATDARRSNPHEACLAEDTRIRPTGNCSTKRARKRAQRSNMAYNQAAIAARRCTATKADGTPCRAWALWDDPLQRCVNHAGRHRRGKYGGLTRSTRTHYKPCLCAAYAWPHRPGSGLCRWPLPLDEYHPTPACTHSPNRVRPPRGWRHLVPEGGSRWWRFVNQIRD